MKRVHALTVAAMISTGARARAQPAPAPPPAPAPATGPADPYGVPPSPRPPIASHGSAGARGSPGGSAESTASHGSAGARSSPGGSAEWIDFPEVLATPTGWLLPAAVLYSKNSVDTGGGVTSDTRVGLGDVAEFGVATTDQVRERNTLDDKPERIQPYITASFRLGVSEHRLFEHQPGVTLGFRKSFERQHRGFKSRIAELTLVASKHLGPRAALHVGGSLWDASLQSTAEVGPDEAPPPELTLHGHGRARQIRAFGGLETRPLPRSSILIDLGWGPEFCYECADDDKIRLRPELSWGVRYQVAPYMHLESGVRVPDIGNFNLLDAQIFGQVTFTSYALRNAVDSLK